MAQTVESLREGAASKVGEAVPEAKEAPVTVEEGLSAAETKETVTLSFPPLNLMALYLGLVGGGLAWVWASLEPVTPPVLLLAPVACLLGLVAAARGQAGPSLGLLTFSAVACLGLAAQIAPWPAVAALGVGVFPLSGAAWLLLGQGPERKRLAMAGGLAGLGLFVLVWWANVRWLS